jgi:hypothetical protein
MPTRWRTPLTPTHVKASNTALPVVSPPSCPRRAAMDQRSKPPCRLRPRGSTHVPSPARARSRHLSRPSLTSSNLITFVLEPIYSTRIESDGTEQALKGSQVRLPPPAGSTTHGSAFCTGGSPFPPLGKFGKES